jgi:hypothetical protein
MHVIHGCDAQLSFECKAIIDDVKFTVFTGGGERSMSSLIKSTVLSLALLGGVAATAHAQSVSALPPTGPATAPSAATTAYSSAKIYPDPGGSVNFREEHSAPVSSAKVYPDPGGSANWQNQHYTTTEGDKDPAKAPYSTSHFGPAPN